MIDDAARFTIGQTLQSARKAKALTQAQAAEVIGMSRQQVSDIERGVFTGSLRILEQYLLFLGYELAITPKAHDFPQLDELSELFVDE